jgi:predicted glycosyltransferase
MSAGERRFSGAPVRRPRVVLYSHDTMGLGHMRRNLLIAHVLARPPLEATVLLVAGARRATAFPLPPGADCLTLPALRKEKDGTYRARRLDVSLRKLIALRSNAIRSTVLSFDPDVFIVDNVPRGAVRELDPVLDDVRRLGHTHCVLGLRDVLDDAAAVHRDWSRAENEDAIRSFFDSIWVYGDRAVYDVAREYAFAPDVAEKLRYTGYLDQRARLELGEEDDSETIERLGLPPGRLALCLLGGGQDGAGLGEAFARADLPPDFNGLIVMGPFLDPSVQRKLRRLVRNRPQFRAVDFIREPIRYAVHADRLVSMGGYNTVCEALSLGKPSLVVPRVTPRTEQLIRARRLEALGLLTVLHPDDLSPTAVSRWLAREGAPSVDARTRIDLCGLDRLPGLVEESLAPPVPSRRSTFFRQGAPSAAY